MRRSRIRIRWIFSGAIAVLALMAVGGIPAASARSEHQLKTVKFVIDFRGNLNASWHDATAVDLRQFRCSGDDETGTFTSSVRPGHKRSTLVLSKDFSHVDATWNDNHGAVKSNRTSQGWMMGVKDHQCQQLPMIYADCGANAFEGPAQLTWVGGSAGASFTRIFLEWQQEPYWDEAKTPHCSRGEVYDPSSVTGTGAGFAKLSLDKLYRCGVRKGRRCTMTISSTKDFPYHVVQGDLTEDSSVHVDWSATFRAVKR